MARLTYPTAPDLLRTLAGKQGGAEHAIDALSTASLDDGDLTVTMVDDVTLSLARQPNGGRWDVTADVPDIGAAVVLPESIVSRANRLMSADGVSILRDWRTKTHVLRAGPRRVLPLLGGETVSALLTGSGWQAVPGSTPTPNGQHAAPAASPMPAPIARTEQDVSAPSAPTLQLTATPAAYRGDIVLSKATRWKWAAASAVHASGFPMVVAVIGPSGAGKTHAVHSLSAAEGHGVVKFDASGVVEPGDWFGTVTLDGDGTHFVPSDLLTALTMPGARTLLIDEANRSAQRAMNALLPILDGSGTFTVPQTGKRMAVNPQVQVVFTANIGARHLAVEPLDEAIRTRISAWIEVDALSEAEESDLLLSRLNGTASTRTPDKVPTFAPSELTPYLAERLAHLGQLVRGASEVGGYAPLSTRQLLSAARLMAVGLDPKLAVDAAILGGYSSEGGERGERYKVNVHASGIAWREPKPGQVMTGDGVCLCGHTQAEHGIGTEVSPSTHCRTCARAYPNNPIKQCMTFSGAMRPEVDPDEDPSV